MKKTSGEYKISLRGREFTLVYDMRAFAHIQDKFGLEIIERMQEGVRISTLVEILAAGLYRHHPEITADVIFDMDPPLHEMADPMDKAINGGWFASVNTGEHRGKKKKGT